MPVVVKLAFGVVVNAPYSFEATCWSLRVMKCILTRVVTVRVVGGVVLVLVVLEYPGSQMLKFQKLGSDESKDLINEGDN
jgi:hypothetical protein